MKTLMRHGLAVCLALTTMCTSLLLVYSSLGGQKERPPQQQQQQAPVTSSAQPAAESSPQPRLVAPAGPRPLDGYLGVADHKEDLQYLAQHWLVHNDDCSGAV
ncbi:alpha-N-acetylgalactosaminide alpha-2,6-sialyltransferase 5 [Marmota flaviventris]|uniref:alpha-N-acetylgalactosaminide alpha-2,6-sialyltransferase 5 n=1 Tax=Marmota flaviventris TaxID=93162 RepID=UPI000FFF945A|nr:alpha-N-acetylgalactosaminide alpha-2,6-sialyltransferase 5 isoform X2 [Marmota flaviventris]